MEFLKKGFFLGFLLLFAVKAEACIPQVNWADSLSFCQGNSFTLSAFNPNSNYLWSTGATTSSITVSKTGSYWVSVTNSCGTTRDTVFVNVDVPVFPNLGADRLMCSNGKAQLNVNKMPGTTYLWQDGSTGSSYKVDTSGTYWVAASNACGSFFDTVDINYEIFPDVDLGPNLNYCNAFSKVLDANPRAYDNILWSTGARTASITVTSPGTYWVEKSNNCGVDRDTIRITQDRGSQLSLGDTAYKCANGFATLRSNVSGGSYLWSTGATTRSISVGSIGQYWLQYTDACGSYTDTVEVVIAPPAQADLGPDTTFCEGTNLILDARNPGSNYRWINGSTDRYYAVNKTGTYWVGVNNGCGWDYDTIRVRMIPLVNPLIADTLFYCPGTADTVDAGYWGPSTTYQWSNGSTGRYGIFNSTGTDSVTVSNDCFSRTYIFEVYPSQNFDFDLPGDTIVCGKQFLINTGLRSQQFTYSWSTGSSTPAIKVGTSGVYSVTVSNGCYTKTDSVEVILILPPERVVDKNVNLCQGSSVSIGGNRVSYTKYSWSTGDTTSRISVNAPGFYVREARNFCDTVIDTVRVGVEYPINIDLGRDTAFCEPGILLLDVSKYNADSIFWNTTSRNAQFPIRNSGTYWVQLFNACGMFSDTITVTVNREPVTKLKNKVYCVGDSVTLDVSQPQGLSYQWSDGSVTPSIKVTQPGWYFVDITSPCGTIRDSAFLRREYPLPPIDLGNDTVFCKGTLLLDPGDFPYAKYKWQNGSTDSTFTVNYSGTFGLELSNSCNSVTDSITVIITGPPQLVLGTIVRFCTGSSLQLNAQNPGSTYLWNTGATTQSINISQPGRYWVTMENDCGKLTDSVDVVVENPMPDVSAGPDTLICKGDIYYLYTQYPDARHRWNTGETSDSILIDSTGTYVVEVSNTCGKWYDTTRVIVQGLPRFDLTDVNICNDSGQVAVEGPANVLSYDWSNGDSTSGTIFYNPGKAWLTVRNECFSYTDTFNVVGENPIELDLGPDTVLCFGQTYLMSPGDFNYKLFWDDGESKPTREVTRSGEYWVTASNSCGIFNDTVQVLFDQPIEEGMIDTIACDGEETVFDFSGGRNTIEWFDGRTDSIRSFDSEGIYGLSIRNTCGSFGRVIYLKYTDCDCPLYVPNAFTPNDDGLNEELTIGYDCLIGEYQLEIFDRWGQRVFLSRDIDHNWDGRTDGHEASVGVYNYRLRYTWPVKGIMRERVKRGKLSLIR